MKIIISILMFTFVSCQAHNDKIQQIKNHGGDVGSYVAEKKIMKYATSSGVNYIYIHKAEYINDILLFKDAPIIELSHSDITDKDLEVLKNMNGIKCLLLKDTGVTATGLEILSSLPSLLYLDIGGVAINQHNLKILKNKYPSVEIYWHGPTPGNGVSHPEK